jgi:hypothetical protein
LNFRSFCAVSSLDCCISFPPPTREILHRCSHNCPSVCLSGCSSILQCLSGWHGAGSRY